MKPKRDDMGWIGRVAGASAIVSVLGIYAVLLSLLFSFLLGVGVAGSQRPMWLATLGWCGVAGVFTGFPIMLWARRVLVCGECRAPLMDESNFAERRWHAFVPWGAQLSRGWSLLLGRTRCSQCGSR